MRLVGFVQQATLEVLNKTYQSHKKLFNPKNQTKAESSQNQDMQISQDPPEKYLVRGPKMGPLGLKSNPALIDKNQKKVVSSSLPQHTITPQTLHSIHNQSFQNKQYKGSKIINSVN